MLCSHFFIGAEKCESVRQGVSACCAVKLFHMCSYQQNRNLWFSQCIQYRVFSKFII